jgi:iron-sulfur cluster assembly accessory protein
MTGLTCQPIETNLPPMTETTTEIILTLTPRAAAEVKDILTKPENAGKNFRVYVEQGGCSGMQYGMVFDEARDGDFVSEQIGVTVLVDAISAQYLHGTVVDFSDALTAGGFKITNPNAKESCGCGKSFNA